MLIHAIIPLADQTGHSAMHVIMQGQVKSLMFMRRNSP